MNIRHNNFYQLFCQMASSSVLFVKLVFLKISEYILRAKFLKSIAEAYSEPEKTEHFAKIVITAKSFCNQLYPWQGSGYASHLFKHYKHGLIWQRLYRKWDVETFDILQRVIKKEVYITMWLGLLDIVCGI